MGLELRPVKEIRNGNGIWATRLGAPWNGHDMESISYLDLAPEERPYQGFGFYFHRQASQARSYRHAWRKTIR